jgi:hypothetical protein
MVVLPFVVVDGGVVHAHAAKSTVSASPLMVRVVSVIETKTGAGDVFEPVIIRDVYHHG